ncbi:MAG: hypothetical protein ACJAUV_002355 [Flavobacteriales bacterium]|jgi:hypothetical protein
MLAHLNIAQKNMLFFLEITVNQNRPIIQDNSRVITEEFMHLS